MYKSTLPHRIYRLASEVTEDREGLPQLSVSHYEEAMYGTRRGDLSAIYTICVLFHLNHCASLLSMDALGFSKFPYV